VTNHLCFQHPRRAELPRLAPRRAQFRAQLPRHPSLPEVRSRRLLRATLRLRPDRILLGEVRGGEAFDLLQALNTGHSGTLSTLHANSAGQAIARFTTGVLQSGIELPYRAIRSNIAEALNLLVHIERRQGKRLVTQLYAIQGYDSALDRYDLERLYERAES
jgi:pilus assembly protein CpaF